MDASLLRTTSAPCVMAPASPRHSFESTPSPTGTYTGTNSQRSHGSLGRTVSDEEVFDRDDDHEMEKMEALFRNGAALHDGGNRMGRKGVTTGRSQSLPTKDSLAGPPSRSTMSQRMLQAMHKNRPATVLETSRAEATSEFPRDGFGEGSYINVVRPNMNADGSHDAGPHSRQHQGTTHNHDDSFAGHDLPRASHASSSCNDRLEARISERLQKKGFQRQDSARSEQDARSFSGRRTYPIETKQQTTGHRFSEQPMAHPGRYPMADPTHQREHMHYTQGPRDGAYHHADSRSSIQSHVDPTSGSTTKLPVGFRFSNTTGSGYSASLGGARPSIAASHTSSSARAPVDHRASPHAAHSEQHIKLAHSLDDIEQVVQGLEAVIRAASSSKLPMLACSELERLSASTKQIRTTGTTLILAEVGKPRSEALGILRELVARAVVTQKRIDLLIANIRLLV